MSKIIISEMSYYYTDFYHPIFEHVNLNLDTDWKLGLIGRNGRGKTTLLKLLHRELDPTAGKIITPIKMTFFPYPFQENYSLTMDVIKENIAHLKTLEDEMDEIIREKDEARYEKYSELQTIYQEAEGYEMESKIQREMDEIGLDISLLARNFSTLSGGEKTRIMLISLFLRKDFFLLLDEPTNHLDIAGKTSVASYLRKKKGFIVASHDREFLDQICDHILSINKTTIELEQGNYSSWKQNKDKKELYESRTKGRLEHEICQLEKRAEKSRNWAEVANTQKYPYTGNFRSNGARAYMQRAKRSEENILYDIEKNKNLLKNYEQAKELSIYQTPRSESGWLLKAEHLTFSYSKTSVPILTDFSITVCSGDRIWIRGENGSGKSTLLSLLSGSILNEAVQFMDDLKISISTQEPPQKTGYLSELLKEKNMDCEKFRNLCGCFDLPDDFMERPLETYSSGEQKKVDIAICLSKENQLLFLDEPLNYMDVYFREQLEKALLSDKPTIVFIEHDARFGKSVATKIVDLSSGKAQSDRI